MVSRRKFFSIFIMMAVLFFMFQFSQVYKESGNRYNVNNHVSDRQPSAVDFEADGSGTGGSNDSIYQKSNGNIVLVGNADNETGETVSQWCSYTKRNLRVVSDISRYRVKGSSAPDLVLIDGKEMHFRYTSEAEELLEIVESGIPVVFCSLPDVKYIMDQEILQEILGIDQVKYRRTRLEGIYLFSGFLLGGEAVYKAEDDISQKRQDLTLMVPWYITGMGTKTYMTGMVADKAVDREDYPALIWRNNYHGTFVFAVEGDYMESATGLGILDAFAYEMSDYEIYPVVNAQNMMVTDYPGFASENRDRMMEYYGRDAKAVYRDIIWPGVEALTQTNKMKLTCYMNPQFDYEDIHEPDASQMVFYLQQLNEMNAEAGRSLTCNFGISLKEKDERDNQFYGDSTQGYRFTAAYVGETIPEGLEAELPEGLSDIRTLACADSLKGPVLSYLTKDVTLQKATGNAQEYFYSTDLQRRSLLTALGYSNVLVDMYDISWPSGEKDRWESFYEDISSNIATFWSDNDIFRKTTLSESDASVRSLLNLRYVHGKENNILRMQVKDMGEDTWFILRTHGEDIAYADGAEYEKIEKDAFLLHITSTFVTVRLEPSDDILRYAP